MYCVIRTCGKYIYIPEREGNGSWIENCLRQSWEQNISIQSENLGPEIGKTSVVKHTTEETYEVPSRHTTQDTRTAQMRTFQALNDSEQSTEMCTEMQLG